MRILITGGLGQLGRALQAQLNDHKLVIADLPEVDISDPASFTGFYTKVQPDLVIHCAAYTDVDGCARDPELAYRVNALGTQNVALACLSGGSSLVHVSTNEVFAGDKTDGYEEWMPLSPINPYGRSKAAAEDYVRHLLRQYYIVRTAWLYGHGGHNFIHAIIKRARSGKPLQVVADEVGNPTYVNDLAEAIKLLIQSGQFGTYHFTNSGACSRWEFARQILRLSGLVEVTNVPILGSQYMRVSTPPRFGALKNVHGASLGITLRSWREALADFLASL